MYAELDEPDGVAGVTTLQSDEPPLDQRILALEVAGKFFDAATCYECMQKPLKLQHFKVRDVHYLLGFQLLVSLL